MDSFTSPVRLVLLLALACGGGQPEPPKTPPVTAPPLLPPLMGMDAMKQETHTVLQDLIAHLPPDRADRVKTIPLIFEADEYEVNAFAGCDEDGAFLAGTHGLLNVLDGLVQTAATDELLGTHAYDAYVQSTIDKIMHDQPDLRFDVGALPADAVLDRRRMSRAHELFDEVVGFTFGHELAHHYLGHTPCAAKTSAERNLATLGDIATQFMPILNQPAEVAADTWGIINVLETGRTRKPVWTNQGASLLLDFFAKLEASAGGKRSILKAFLMTHPPSTLRMRVVNDTYTNWVKNLH